MLSGGSSCKGLNSWTCKLTLWGRSRDYKVVVIPAILLIVTIVDGSLIMAFAGHGYGADHNGPLHALISAYYVLGLIFNTLVTALIVGRIWMVGHRSRSTGTRQNGVYLRVIVCLIESGSLYLVTLAVYLILYSTYVSTSSFTPLRISLTHTQNNAQVIVLEALPVVAGMVPTLIILVHRLLSSDKLLAYYYT